MSSREQMLAIPADVRLEVDERDGGVCRLCGRADGVLCQHHIEFGGDYVGMGGRRLHEVSNIITLGGSPWHDCHARVHRHKNLWLPYLLLAVETPGVTVLQLKRWTSG